MGVVVISGVAHQPTSGSRTLCGITYGPECPIYGYIFSGSGANACPECAELGGRPSAADVPDLVPSEMILPDGVARPAVGDRVRVEKGAQWIEVTGPSETYPTPANAVHVLQPTYFRADMIFERRPPTPIERLRALPDEELVELCHRWWGFEGPMVEAAAQFIADRQADFDPDEFLSTWAEVARDVAALHDDEGGPADG